jgi:hypothetical protein
MLTLLRGESVHFAVARKVKRQTMLVCVNPVGMLFAPHCQCICAFMLPVVQMPTNSYFTFIYGTHSFPRSSVFECPRGHVMQLLLSCWTIGLPISEWKGVVFSFLPLRAPQNTAFESAAAVSTRKLQMEHMARNSTRTKRVAKLRPGDSSILIQCQSKWRQQISSLEFSRVNNVCFQLQTKNGMKNPGKYR